MPIADADIKFCSFLSKYTFVRCAVYLIAHDGALLSYIDHPRFFRVETLHHIMAMVNIKGFWSFQAVIAFNSVQLIADPNVCLLFH
jgi:hypothetical protein